MRTFRQKYTAKDGTTRESAKWYVELKDHNDVRRRIPGFSDKKLTEELGRKLERLAMLRSLNQPMDVDLGRWLETMPAELRDRLAKIGLLDSRAVAQTRPLSEHLDDFHRSLLDKGNTSEHAETVTKRSRKLITDCKFTFYSDINGSRVQRKLADMRKGSKSAASISYQTSNFYLQAIKQLCRWMVRDRRASESPVEHLAGLNVKLDRRHDRRSLSADELIRLLIETRQGPVRHKLTGPARAMLYRVAMETGLRRNELRALTPGSLNLDAEPPHIDVSAGDVKNRKPTSQVIRPELAVELGRWIQEAQIGPKIPLWPKLTANTAMMLRKDLEAAEIEYVDASDLYADFHSLRHSYVSLITQGGVHPRIAQSLARHSTAELTLSRYSHTVMTDEARALEVLPALPSLFDNPNHETQIVCATGTDGDSGLPSGLPKPGTFESAAVRPDAPDGRLESIPFEMPEETKEARKPLIRGRRASIESGEGGIRTHGTREGTLVFETSTFGHSVTSPMARRDDRPGSSIAPRRS